MSYLHLLRVALPEAVLTLAALAALATQILFPQSGGRTFGRCPAIAAIGILAAMGAILGLPHHETLFNGMLVINPLTSMFKLVCLAMSLLTVLLARRVSFAQHTGDFFALLLLGTVGLLLLVGSEELLMIFIGLELTGLSLYVMTGFDKSDIRSVEAGLKYFLFGSTASAFALFGISLVYGACGSTLLAHIPDHLTSQTMHPMLAAGLIMMLAGFAFKIAAAPFHLWAPDAYQGAPLPAAALIASGSKVASFVVLGKILLIGFGQVRHDWMPLIAALAATSIVIGNLAALAQDNVRRLLAYSAVAHAGYTLLGFLAPGPEGFASTLFYTTTYALTIVGAFGVVAYVRNDSGREDLAAFSGLRARSPLLAGCMAIFLFSLAGLPPLAGFFGKLYLFTAALSTPRYLWLVALALAGSLVSLYYYLIILKRIFVDEPANNVTPVHLDAHQRVTLLILGAAVVGLGLFPDALLTYILKAVSYVVPGIR